MKMTSSLRILLTTSFDWLVCFFLFFFNSFFFTLFLYTSVCISPLCLFCFHSGSTLCPCPATFLLSDLSPVLSICHSSSVSLFLSHTQSLSLSRRPEQENERQQRKENPSIITLSLHLRKAKYLNCKPVKKGSSQQGGRN